MRNTLRISFFCILFFFPDLYTFRKNYPERESLLKRDVSQGQDSQDGQEKKKIDKEPEECVDQEDVSEDKRIICSLLLSLFNTYKELCHEDMETEQQMDALRYMWYEDRENEEKRGAYDDSVRKHREAEWDHYIMRDTPLYFKIKIKELYMQKLLKQFLLERGSKERVKKILLASEPGGLLQEVLEKTILLNFMFRQLRFDTRRSKRRFSDFSNTADIIEDRRKKCFTRATSCDIGSLQKAKQQPIVYSYPKTALDYKIYREQAILKSRFLLDQFPKIRDYFFSQRRFENERLGQYIQMLKREHYFVEG